MDADSGGGKLYRTVPSAVAGNRFSISRQDDVKLTRLRAGHCGQVGTHSDGCCEHCAVLESVPHHVMQFPVRAGEGRITKCFTEREKKALVDGNDNYKSCASMLTNVVNYINQ